VIKVYLTMHIMTKEDMTPPNLVIIYKDKNILNWLKII
jgi:hypothetical protein